jgi:hypothetical protein
MSEEFVIKKIIDKRLNNLCQHEYLIQWEGYPIDKASWENEEALENVKEFIVEYENSCKQKSKKDENNLFITSKAQNKKIEFREKMPIDEEPEKVINVKKIHDKLCCLVEWKENSYGVKRENCFIPNEIFKENYSILLIEYYETKVKFN